MLLSQIGAQVAHGPRPDGRRVKQQPPSPAAPLTACTAIRRDTPISRSRAEGGAMRDGLTASSWDRRPLQAQWRGNSGSGRMLS